MGSGEQDFSKAITREDLREFKKELLREIGKMIGTQTAVPERSWLKSHEVRRLLKISSGTLQHLRDSGKLKFSKVGGIFFYDIRDIEAMTGGQS